MENNDFKAIHVEISSTNQWIAVISVTNRARTKIFSPKYSLKKTYLGGYSL